MLVVCLAAAFSSPIARAQEPATDRAATNGWPQFLGAGSVAHARGASTLDFDLERDVRYHVTLPHGESSPCIWGDRMFLTGLVKSEGGDAKLVMFALDRRSGKELWRHEVPGPKHTDFMHADAGVAMPTACSNGERVFFYFPSYGLVARTVDGDLAWEKKLPEPESGFGIGSSPMHHEGRVYLLRDGCPDAALYALDEATGEELWVAPRIAFSDSHATPFVWRHGDKTELVIASSGAVMSLSFETGQEIWRVDGLTPLICTTPTATDDMLYFAGWSTPAAVGVERLLAGAAEPIEISDAEREDPALLFARFDANKDGKLVQAELPRGRLRSAFSFLDQDADGGVSVEEWTPLFTFPSTGKNLLIAIRPGGEGNITESHVAWSVRRGIPYVASPLVTDGRVWLAKAGGIITCVDAATGDVVAKTRLEDQSEYYSSPVAVDGVVVLCSSGGTVYVLDERDGEIEVLRSVELGDRIFATPAVVDGTVYVRTLGSLYAFGR